MCILSGVPHMFIFFPEKKLENIHVGVKNNSIVLPKMDFKYTKNTEFQCQHNAINFRLLQLLNNAQFQF